MYKHKLQSFEEQELRVRSDKFPTGLQLLGSTIFVSINVDTFPPFCRVWCSWPCSRCCLWCSIISFCRILTIRLGESRKRRGKKERRMRARTAPFLCAETRVIFNSELDSDSSGFSHKAGETRTWNYESQYSNYRISQSNNRANVDTQKSNWSMIPLSLTPLVEMALSDCAEVFRALWTESSSVIQPSIDSNSDVSKGSRLTEAKTLDICKRVTQKPLVVRGFVKYYRCTNNTICRRSRINIK